MANTRVKQLNGNDDSYIIADSDLTAVIRDKVIAKKGGITITLPEALKYQTSVFVKNIGASDVTVEPDGSEKIGSGSTFAVTSDTTIKFTVIGAGFWKAEVYEQSDELVRKLLGDSVVFVNLEAGAKVKILTTNALK